MRASRGSAMRRATPGRVGDVFDASAVECTSAAGQWVCCFTCNEAVFGFLTGLGEEAAGCVVCAYPLRGDAWQAEGAEVVLAPLRAAQEDTDGEWVRCPGGAAWVVKRHRLVVVTPLSPWRLTSLCLYGNKVMGWLLRVRARILSEQAYISTLGGGFASVRNVPKAIEYAVKLFYCACLLGDEDMKSKSRLFVGWSMLWIGNKKYARQIFLAEIDHCRRMHNEVGVQRGYGAMHQLEHNPSSKDKGDVVPDPALQWHQVFSTDDQSQQITQDAHSRAYEISELTRKIPAEAPEGQA